MVTLFASVKAIGGITCSQVYAGRKSYYKKVFGMQREANMPDSFGDFIRKVGAPYGFFTDNAKSELSAAVKDYL